MRVARKTVGIDLGATAVRVVEVSGLDGDSVAQITKCAIVPMPAGGVVGGKIKDVHLVSWALTQALKEAKVNTYGAVLGVSGPDTVVTPIVLSAALRPDEWLLALRTAGQELSPKVPLEDASVSLYAVPGAAQLANPNARELLAAATTDAEVATLMAVAKRTKITPKAIDLSAAAVVRALTRAVPGNEDVATLVDIGSSKVTVATRQGLHLRSVRTFEGGGERITRSVMGALGDGATYDEAEEAKLSMKLTSSGSSSATDFVTPTIQSLYGAMPQAASTLAPGGNAAHDALQTAAAALVEDIASAVEADAAMNPARPTRGLHLCGGTALLRGLTSQLVQRVGVPAVIMGPWARIVPSKYTEAALNDGVEDPVVLLSLATAVGLAIWKDPR